MDAPDIVALIDRATRELGCDAVMLRCECSNLETVYLTVRRGEVLATDSGETCAYLDRPGSSTYASLEIIGDARLAELCAQCGTVLVQAEPDDYPRIECSADLAGGAPQAVARVAAAIDAVFAEAMARVTR